MRRMSLALLLAAAVVGFAAPRAHGMVLVGAVTASDPTQNGSVSLTNTGSTCASPKAYPGTDPGLYRYDKYSFVNLDSVAHCYGISVTSSGLLQVAAYVSYTPNDPSSFYLGDAGFCTNLGTSGTISFQVQIQPGHSFDVVVQECVQNTPASYTLSTTAGALDGYVNTNSPSTTRYLGASGPSGCGSPPPTPPLQVAGFGVRYAAYTFVGNLGDCETASLSVAYSANFGVNAGIIGYAYSGSFDPNNPDQNYLGDSGQCADLRTNTSQVNFSWRVPASGQYAVVLRQCSTSDDVSFGGEFWTLSFSSGPPTDVRVRSARATRSRRGMLVRWRTGAESDVLGFAVYRERAGRRVRVGRGLVPAVFGGTPKGHAYTFLDRAAPRAGSLRYWLRVVRLDGSKSWYGPFAARPG